MVSNTDASFLQLQSTSTLGKLTVAEHHHSLSTGSTQSLGISYFLEPSHPQGGYTSQPAAPASHPSQSFPQASSLGVPLPSSAPTGMAMTTQQAAELYSLAAKCKDINNSLACDFQHLTEQEAADWLTTQVSAQETVNAGRVAHATAFTWASPLPLNLLLRLMPHSGSSVQMPTSHGRTLTACSSPTCLNMINYWQIILLTQEKSCRPSERRSGNAPRPWLTPMACLLIPIWV